VWCSPEGRLQDRYAIAIIIILFNNTNNNLPAAYMFQPFALETLGAINASAGELLADLGRKIRRVSFSAAFHSSAAIQRDPTA